MRYKWRAIFGIGLGTSLCLMLYPKIQVIVCEKQREALLLEFKAPQPCAKDSDCTQFPPGCPFGCGTFATNPGEIPKLRVLLDKYRQKCGACSYDCQSLPQVAHCTNELCVLTKE